MFRSEAMVLCQLFIAKEATYQSLAELGEKGIVQFKDLNSGVNSFQRKFVHQVRRCEEFERKLRYMRNAIQKENIPIPECVPEPHTPELKVAHVHETAINKAEAALVESTNSLIGIKQNLLELREMQAVFDYAKDLFQEPVIVRRFHNYGKRYRSAPPDIENRKSQNEQVGHLGFMTGVIGRDKLLAFERILWRISRGNAYIKQADEPSLLEDPVSVSTHFN